MLYLRHCITAFLTPWGRLSPAPFAVMTMVLMAAHISVQMHINAQGEDLQPYNAWSMTLFLLMWPAFCLTSRRFHDSGKSAIFLIPLLVVTFASYLAVLDDLHLATSVFDEDRELLRTAERVRFALQILGMIAMGAALLRPGDAGENSFGREFYAGNASASASRMANHIAPMAASTANARKVVAAAQAPVASAIRRQEFLADGPRGRITPGEAARHKADGFGRR